MSTLFSQALLSCVGEGREPHAQEVAALTEKIWREAYGPDSQPNSCQRAAMFALAALGGKALAKVAIQNASICPVKAP